MVNVCNISELNQKKGVQTKPGNSSIINLPQFPANCVQELAIHYKVDLGAPWMTEKNIATSGLTELLSLTCHRKD